MSVRIYPDVPRVYFDQDGVLADFEKGMAALGVPPSVFKRIAGGYINLDPVPGAQEAVRRISGSYLIFVLTKIPSSNPYAATEKLLWLQKHFGTEFEDRVIITPDKGAVGTPRDFLIDDFPHWANANNFPGTILHFKGDWTPILTALDC